MPGVTSQPGQPPAFATPSPEQIVHISAQHVALMEASDADDTWIWLGMEHLLLTTVGRRSGLEHRVALPFWRDPDGHRVVVASFAGSDRHPAWFANLADRAANPDVAVRVQRGAYRCVPEILDGDEHARLWRLLVADRPWYADYQAGTERRIPLVRLPQPG